MFCPPVISTSPFARRVAVLSVLGLIIWLVILHLPVTWSYNSGLSADPLLPEPPVTNTLPLASEVATKLDRALIISPVELHTPVAGS